MAGNIVANKIATITSGTATGYVVLASVAGFYKGATVWLADSTNTEASKKQAIITEVDAVNIRLGILLRDPANQPTYGRSTMAAYTGGTVNQPEQFLYNPNDTGGVNASSTSTGTSVVVAGTDVSDTNPMPVKGVGFQVDVSATRTTNTTAYDALDVIGINNAGSAGSAIHTFSPVGPSGGYINLTSLSFRYDANAVPSGMTTFRLHLYTVAPTAIVDGATFNLVSADRAGYIGYVDFTAPIDMGDTLWSQVKADFGQIKLPASSTTLYGILQTTTGWTPASGTTYALRICSEGK